MVPSHVQEIIYSVLRPTAAALDRLNHPQQVIDPGSPLWTALKAAYAQGFHTALIPTECGGLACRA